MEPPARRGGYALRSRPVDARDRCDDRCRHHYAEQSPHRAIAVKSNVSQQAGGERSACSRRLRDHREPSSKAWHSTVSKGAARGEAKRALWPPARGRSRRHRAKSRPSSTFRPPGLRTECSNSPLIILGVNNIVHSFSRRDPHGVIRVQTHSRDPREPCSHPSMGSQLYGSDFLDFQPHRPWSVCDRANMDMP
jgi:hypothetical protein